MISLSVREIKEWEKIQKSVIAEAAIEWHRLRLSAMEAKNARRKAREDNGGCDPGSSEDFFQPDKCYRQIPDKKDWCEVCQAQQPFHEAYRAASIKAATAKRKLALEVRRLLASKHHENSETSP